MITSRIEHKAVLDPMKVLEKRGFEVTRLQPDSTGKIDPQLVTEALRPDTILVSLMLANNEVGTLNPIAKLTAETRSRGILLHTDAAQAVGKIAVDVNTLGADLLSISAHKLYGPKGVGALYVRGRAPRARIAAIQFGGGHERGLRSGTLPVPLIVGLGEACALADPERAQSIGTLAHDLQVGLAREIPDARFNGHPDERIPGILSVTLPGIESESLMLGMPEIAVSSGSACTSAELEPSHVLMGMGLSKGEANCTVRFGVGRTTTTAEIAFTVERVASAVERIRRR